MILRYIPGCASSECAVTTWFQKKPKHYFIIEYTVWGEASLSQRILLGLSKPAPVDVVLLQSTQGYTLSCSFSFIKLLLYGPFSLVKVDPIT